jgi:release factor glutamine methyltransferase
LIARREQREPLAYITGVREFWGLAFEVSPAVLVPRPETELLVEAALARWPLSSPLRAADVCTGSGCIAIALAHERPAASILATDLSAEALEIAGRNAVRHHVAARVECLRTDLLEDAPGTFDLVVSNPPYVPEGDRAGLQAEVSHEPDLALFSGTDGLNAIVRLAAQAESRLKPGGLFLFEFGAGQEDQVRTVIAARSGLRLIELKHDLQGIPRTAIAARV